MKAVLSEWNLQSWEGRHYETSVRTLLDEEKPFIQKGEIIHSWTGIILRSCNMNASSHTGFLLVLEMTSSLTCKDLHNNSVSVIHWIELATAESNTHMCYSTASRRSQIDSRTPALASHQAAPLLWNGRLKCKINVENNNRTTWFIARFADVMTKTED